jgi:protein-disulfide isomerase
VTNARGAAEAALAANAQGKFWEFHDRLFEHQSELDRANLEDQAKAVGLNVPAFKKALDQKEYSPAVESDMKMGETAAVQGTPTMFVNGARIDNPTSFETVSAQIETALKSAG